MSGIFKGDSIYKSGGGGGGGYKDGGQLVDADFIEVKNNTISTYDNESRNPVNFYFTVTEGEIINSIINFTTDVNAVINVYMYKNGIYYLLGNVGGNTVNASKIYTINVINYSFVIDEVSDNPEPEWVLLGNELYGLSKIGNRFWLNSNCRLDAVDLGVVGNWPIGRPNPQSTYPGYFYRLTFGNDNYIRTKEKLYPLRIPTKEDVEDLYDTVGGNSLSLIATGWDYFPNATNTYKFNAIPCGTYSFNYGVSSQGYDIKTLLYASEDGYGNLKSSYYQGNCVFDPNGGFSKGEQYAPDQGGYNLRLCMDITPGI